MRSSPVEQRADRKINPESNAAPSRVGKLLSLAKKNVLGIKRLLAVGLPVADIAKEDFFLPNLLSRADYSGAGKIGKSSPGAQSSFGLWLIDKQLMW